MDELAPFYQLLLPFCFHLRVLCSWSLLLGLVQVRMEMKVSFLVRSLWSKTRNYTGSHSIWSSIYRL